MKLGCVIYYFVPEFGNDITLLKTSLRRRAVRQDVGYKTPATLPEEEAVARSGVNVWIETPSKPRSVVFDTRSRITLRASLVGIANPSPKILFRCRPCK